jgi:hypothetical protein
LCPHAPNHTACSMADAPQLVCIDRPCRLKFTIESVTNTAAFPEPFNICALTRGACASSAFSRPKVKGKSDPKNPAVEPVALLCDVWWRPALVRFACCSADAGAEFPEGEAALGCGQWELLHAVECSGRCDGPDCEFSVELTAANGSGDAVVSMGGRVCAVWDEEFCDGAAGVGEALEDMITAAIAAHEDKRLNALAAEVAASVSMKLCLSTIDILGTAHELLRALHPPDADLAAPAGDVHMRGVLPVTRRPPPSALKVNVADAAAAAANTNVKAASHAKPLSAKSTPRAAATDAVPPPLPAVPLQPAPQMKQPRPATAHPSRKTVDAQLQDADDGISLHSGAVPCIATLLPPPPLFPPLLFPLPPPLFRSPSLRDVLFSRRQ